VDKVKKTAVTIGRAVKIPALAFILALIAGGIMIAISGYNPFWVYYQVFALAFSSAKNIASVFAQATPLMFTGVAYAVAAKCGLVNLGLEGQMLRILGIGFERCVHPRGKDVFCW